MKSVHKLMAKAFLPNPENKPDINHINGVKDDNRLCNLEWCTKSENQTHRYEVLKKGNLSIGKRLKKNFKKVKKIKTDGTLVCEYTSLMDASVECGINYTMLSAKLNKGLVYKGHIWEAYR